MEEKYFLDGKTYDKSQIEYYAKKSKVSFDEYINLAGVKKVKSKEPVITQKKATETAQYIIDGKNYDKAQVEYYAKKSNVSFDEYIELAGVKKKEPTNGTGQPSPKASSTRTDRSKPLSATERPQDQKVSDGSGGGFSYSAKDLDPKTREALGIKPEPIELKPSFMAMTDKDVKKAEREKLYREPVRESTMVAMSKQGKALKQTKEEKKTELDIAKENAKERAKLVAQKKAQHYSDLGELPNAKFSVYNQPIDERDNASGIARKRFVQEYFNEDDLLNLGINPVDFDGFLERKNLKETVLNRDLKGGFGDKEENRVAKQSYLSNMVKMYLDEKEFMVNDYQKSMKEIESPSLEEPKITEYKYDRNSYREYIAKNFPDLDRSIKISEEKDKQSYQEILEKQDNPILETAYLLKNTAKGVLGGIGSAVRSTAPLLYESLGFEGVADDIRDRALVSIVEEKPKREASGYIQGREVKYKNRDYLVSEDGIVYDKNLEMSVDGKLPEQDIEKIKKEAETKGKDSSIFGVQGMFHDFGSVMGDMAWQMAFQAAVSKGTTPILGAAGKYAKVIPKATGDAIIAQGLYGYSTAYEDTLRTARDKGISEQEAVNIAKEAAKMTGYLYAATAPLQPGEKFMDAIAGKSIKSIASEAVESYLKNGKQGLSNYLVDAGRVFLKEGAKEAAQENVQQIAETYIVNRKVNDIAGQELKNEDYSIADFVNTSILSMAAGGAVPGISAAFSGTKRGNYNNLYSLGENITKAQPVINELVSGGVISRQDADSLIRKANAVYKNSTKIPNELPVDKKTEISVLLEDINDLEDKKKTLDVSFHEDINKQIEAKRNEIKEVTGRPEEVVAEEVVEKPTEQKPEAKNSLSLFQEISDMTNKSQMQEFSQQNPDVAFIHNNIEGIIKGIDGAKVVEC